MFWRPDRWHLGISFPILDKSDVVDLSR